MVIRTAQVGICQNLRIQCVDPSSTFCQDLEPTAGALEGLGCEGERNG